MALSKLPFGASLCRAFYRSCNTGRIFKTGAVDTFRQPSFANTYTQVQPLSTSFGFHDRHIVRKNSALNTKLKESVSRSRTSKTETSHSKSVSNQGNKSTDGKDNDKTKTVAKAGEEKPEEKMGIFQRFKVAYKQHGKILIGVHLATSTVWFGSFWYLVHNGVDVVSFLERLGVSERILNPVKSSGAGDIAIAYLLYKVATPARYTVTLGGTNFVIKYMRKTGKMGPQKEKMRDLMKDSRSAMKPKLSQTQLQRLQIHLRSLQARSKSRVMKIRGKSQKRLVQLRKFLHAKDKNKTR